jgi:2,4-dienoyl-CoA reductase-like NADH-dependent reductase (Old Yellow Enzyme family)
MCFAILVSYFQYFLLLQLPVNTHYKNALFNKGKLGNLNTYNKMVMAPMTRSRTAQPGDIPTELMATYYAQVWIVGDDGVGRMLDCPVPRALSTQEIKGIAYIHLAEADWDGAPVVTQAFRQQLRENFTNAIVVAGNYTLDKADVLINSNLVDYVAFGRKFLANPDLPYRLANNLPLNVISDPTTLFGGDERGYTDYPIYEA